VRLVWAALVVAAGACSEPKPATRGLRIPLPEGWVASPTAAGVLRVGPKGRAVLTLEKRAAALPSLEALEAAVVAEGAAVTHAEANASRILLRYARPDSAEALLAARLLEPGMLLLCASTVETEAEELDAAQALCGNVRLDAAP
jgi:hypothetical protein